MSQEIRDLIGLHSINIYQRSTEDVTQQIRKDRIDILIDLSGHCEGNGLDLFVNGPTFRL